MFLYSLELSSLRENGRSYASKHIRTSLSFSKSSICDVIKHTIVVFVYFI